jgi:hypothetical protein
VPQAPPLSPTSCPASPISGSAPPPPTHSHSLPSQPLTPLVILYRLSGLPAPPPSPTSCPASPISGSAPPPSVGSGWPLCAPDSSSCRSPSLSSRYGPPVTPERTKEQKKKVFLLRSFLPPHAALPHAHRATDHRSFVRIPGRTKESSMARYTKLLYRYTTKEFVSAPACSPSSCRSVSRSSRYGPPVKPERTKEQ